MRWSSYKGRVDIVKVAKYRKKRKKKKKNSRQVKTICRHYVVQTEEFLK